MSIGIWQVVLILLIVLIVFGAGKLPKVMGDVAKGVKNFRAGLKDDGEADGDESAATAGKSQATLPPAADQPTTVSRADVKDEVAKT
jgi:sec-independent protein translocase protein TatA